jgi:uncharacterized protein
MLSGRRLDLLDPSPLDVEIEDIAHGLARVARWNGQTFGEHAFSVAQHSLAVEAILAHVDDETDPRVLATALLHDAPEYVIGDMISPFKVAMGGDYSAIEARLTVAVHRRFGLTGDTPALLKKRIKRADKIAAFHEATRLAGFSEAEALRFFGAPPRLPASLLDDVFTPWPTATAQARFLARFAALSAAL